MARRRPRRCTGKSLIIVRDSGPYLLHLNPFSQNAPDLDGQLLYAVDRGVGSFRLLDRYPDRTPYVERTSNPALDDAIHHTDAAPPDVSLLPVVVHQGATVTVHVEVRNPTNAATVVAILQVGDQVEQRILSADPSRPGVYDDGVDAGAGRRERRRPGPPSRCRGPGR